MLHNRKIGVKYGKMFSFWDRLYPAEKMMTYEDAFGRKIELIKRGHRLYKRIWLNEHNYTEYNVHQSDFLPGMVRKAETDNEELMLLAKFFKILEVLDFDPRDFIEHIKEMGYDDIDIYVSMTLMKHQENEETEGGSDSRQSIDWRGKIKLEDIKDKNYPTKLDEFYNMLFQEFMTPGQM